MNWHRVLAADELPDGRVTTVAAGHKSVALVHYDGQFSALDNRCPHQGGPLGEGSIENGLLRCPWHGFDDCPLDGSSPGIEDEARQDEQEAAGGGVDRLDALHTQTSRRSPQLRRLRRADRPTARSSIRRSPRLSPTTGPRWSR